MSKSEKNLAKATSDWLDANDPNRKKRRKGPKIASGREKRDVRMKKYRPESIKAFTERHRHHKGCECVFVPGADGVNPASVVFCDRTITASRYMCLLTHGTAKSEGMVSRHLCGNGHLSCVNPNHVVWGTPGDNIADANKHRAAGDNVQDRIHSIG